MSKSLLIVGVVAIQATMLFGVTGVLAETQGLAVIINSGMVELEIAPATVMFGPVNPGTENNPATNGPITFNATGSSVNVKVEVTNVTGFPFETGLKLDGTLAKGSGKMWTLTCTPDPITHLCTYEVATTVPTLDVSVAAPQGNYNSGLITYTITGILLEEP